MSKMRGGVPRAPWRLGILNTVGLTIVEMIYGFTAITTSSGDGVR